jgi:RNA polymerase primary sigma factor
MSDMGKAKLLGADDEIWLAEAIERCWLSITREVCNNAHALTILCAVADKVSNRELPPGSLLASHTDFRDEAVSAALGDSVDADELELPEFDADSEESAPLPEDNDWQSTVQKLRCFSQQATATTTQFNVAVRDHAFALLREIRFSEQFVRFLIADLQSDDDVTDLATAGAIRRILSEYEGYRNRFAEANLRLVHSIARTHSYRGLEILELVQEGSLGLLKAVDRFDHRRGFKFSTYATWWIKQSITRAIADKARTIRVPVHMVEKINKVQSVLRRWKNDDIDFDADKIAEELEIPVQKVRKIIGLSGQTSLLADLAQETIDSLVDNSASTAWRPIMDGELRAKASKVLRTLKPKEREIIVKRFGLDVEGEHTLEEVGQSMGVTRERIRQIEAKALKKLRHPVRTRILKPFWEVSK